MNLIPINDVNGNRHFINPTHVIEVRQESKYSDLQRKKPKAVFLMTNGDTLISDTNWDDWCKNVDEMNERIQQYMRTQQSGLVTRPDAAPMPTSAFARP